MKNKTLIIFLLAAMVACNRDDYSKPTSEKPTSKVNVLTTRSTPYLNVYYSDSELLAHVLYTDCSLQNRQSSGKYERNIGPHTIYLDDNNQSGLTITDTYKMDTTNIDETIFHIQREVTIIKNHQKEGVHEKLPKRQFTGSASFSVSVGSAVPITIIRPYSLEGQEIPLCYYEDMEIEWNPDSENNNGVVVIIEWNGIMLDGPNFTNTNIVGIDILDDTGVAVLNNQIFEGIPDGAMVNMWLLRGNIVELLDNDEELTLEDMIHIFGSGDEQILEEYLEMNPELIMQLQQAIVASCACASFTMYLIRNL